MASTDKALQTALPIALAEADQIVVGVLVKYVNFGKGWRHRLFVLSHGVLRYYKVFGPSRINVHQLFESLRRQGELIMIGAETGVIENKWRRGTLASASFNGRNKPVAQGELHMQVSTIQESDADYRKFYVHSGTTTLRLRTETKEDRIAWIEALNRAKGTWGGVTPQVAAALTSNAQTQAQIAEGDDEFLELLAAVRGKLAEKGASREVQAYVEDVLLSEHQHYHKHMSAEAEKRRTLLALVKALENEKRQLETASVVEAHLNNRKLKRSETADGETRSDASESISDAEPDIDEVADTRGQPGDSEDEEFYDAFDEAGRSRSGAPGSPSRSAGSFSEGLTASRSMDNLSLTTLPRGEAGGGGTGWIREELPAPPRRTRLPSPQQQEKSVSLWSIIKECVGKDLTKVCLPVYFNEPLSALQKSAEDLEYSELLDQAAECPQGSVERMLLVAAFAVSGYSGTAGRTSKPFNPLLGETFEFVCPEKGFRFIAEKVVHHPTVVAAYCQGRRWEIQADGDVKSKFWGRSIELHPVGVMALSFDDGEEYTWHKVTTSINNLIIGKLYIDHGGLMRVRNLATGLSARIKFKEAGMLTPAHNAHQVRGYLDINNERLPKPEIYGKWDEALYADMPDGSQQLLWKINPPPEEPTRYNLTSWAIELNEVTPSLRGKLAPTDCRLRPDQHFLELGMYDQANAEKQRLETKQRAARKAAERGDPIVPRWFEPIPGVAAGEGLTYRYKGGYFEARKAGVYEGCRDIFGT
ncbi:hypothetical protein WJX72_009685 [[Myrmecia] bisecta]|uniref:PH domain-containing protein n=1 Tax=[Myrmecia] bisecta TaxID=41462 RepID=A0AAW1PI85_9CHLO